MQVSDNKVNLCGNLQQSLSIQRQAEISLEISEVIEYCMNFLREF